MNDTRIYAAAAVVFLATSIGTSQHVAAQGAYAAAYNNIFNFNITSTDEAELNGPFFIPLDDFQSFTVVSSASATLDGSVDPANPSNSAITGGPANALPSLGLGSFFPGGAPADNAMGPVGLTGNFARSDSQVSSTTIKQDSLLDPVELNLPLQPTQAWGIAEGYIDDDGFAVSASLNSSTTGFNTTINLQQPARIFLNFQAHPFASVVMDAGAAGGSTNANIETTFTITSGGTTVFDWQPDGAISPGGIILGGIEFTDDLDLNGSVEVTSPGDNAFINAAALADLGNIAPTLGIGTFSARTNTLPPGLYTLSLDMAQNIDVVTVAAEPSYDYGDNPDTGPGTGTGNYETTGSDNGARHLIEGPYLGLCVDADDGTLQNATADADDNSTTTATGTCAAGDDEDGITLPAGNLVAGLAYSLDVNMPSGASVEACVVDGWIDFNADGDFTDAGEQIITGLNVANGSGANSVNFNVPPGVQPGQSYSRFRCTRAGGTLPAGEEDNGEVEDYPVTFVAPPPSYDYGDNPDTGPGTGTGNYETTGSDNGARHLIEGPYLGLCVDADDGTLQNATADADDNSTTTATGTCAAGDDEDGITLPAGNLVAGLAYSLDVNMPSGASVEPCVVEGWIDFNADGDFTDAGEQIITGLNVANGSGANSVNFNVPPGVQPGQSYSRFRCTRAGGTLPTGEEDNGEVEDYSVTFVAPPPSYDYGDNPDTGPGTGTGNYETTGSDNGARHLIEGPYLGLCVDADDGTLQNATADADDNSTTTATGTCAAGDDEDGIGLPGIMEPGFMYSLNVSMPVGASAEDCVLDGWIDFNADGDFTDVDEQIIAGLNLTAGSGTTAVNFMVPPATPLGSSYSRFRCTRSGSAGPAGEEDSGEVEDYPVTFAIIPDAEAPVMSPGMLALTGLLLTLLAARRRRRA